MDTILFTESASYMYWCKISKSRFGRLLEWVGMETVMLLVEGTYYTLSKEIQGVAYIVMNNGTYGLTKGQASPTAPEGWKNSSSKGVAQNLEEDLDPIMFGLSIPGSTYLARAYAGQPAQLQRLVTGALEHSRQGHGMGYVEVLSPCVTYNDSYRDWRTRVYDIDSEENYDCTDKSSAFSRMSELRNEGRLPLGLIYRGSIHL